MSVFETTELHIAADDIDAFGLLIARALRRDVIERAGDQAAQDQYVESTVLGCLHVSEGLAMRLRVMGDEIRDFRRAHNMPMAAKAGKTPQSDRGPLRSVDGGRDE